MGGRVTAILSDRDKKVTNEAIKFADIEAAAARLAPFVTRTPLLSALELNRRAGGDVFLKAECLQRTGSFKLRGALNAILQFREEGISSVVAYSSGNHAQGVAQAAKLVGLGATIVMPEDTPAIKKERTQRDGAAIVTYDRYRESREEIAADIAAKSNSQLLPPFDHPYVMAGQGTAGLEIAEEALRSGVRPDQLVIGASGGGLAAGISLALTEVFPDLDILIVEPEGFDDFRRSLEAGERIEIVPSRRSICDALLSPFPGMLTFPILKRLGARAVTVSDQAALDAVGFAARELKTIVEPGGAVGLAAILGGELATEQRTTLSVLSGGNIDDAMLAQALGL
ncbi:MAG: threonine ammonia-lyase [Parvularcula sp.]